MSHKAVCGLGCLATFMLFASGCVGKAGGSPYERAITNVLDRQAKAWNAGDIETFMKPYWKSPHLTFSSGGQITRGWESMRRRYLKAYPTADDMGVLTFSELEILPVATDGAVVLGRWRLDFEEPVGGVFTLVFRRILDDWVIVHDHTWRDGP